MIPSNEVGSSEPEVLRVGESARWNRDVSAEWPASVWTLTYYFRDRAGKSKGFSVVASASGDVHQVRLTPAETGEWAAGEYDWFARVGDGTDVYEILSGRVEVLPELTAAGDGAGEVVDRRSVAERMVAKLEAAWEKLAGGQHVTVSVNGRSYSYRQMSELEGALRYWRGRVESERCAEVPGRGRVYVRF